MKRKEIIEGLEALSVERLVTAVEVLQEWQVEHGKLLPVKKFLRALQLLAEFVSEPPEAAAPPAERIIANAQDALTQAFEEAPAFPVSVLEPLREQRAAQRQARASDQAAQLLRDTFPDAAAGQTPSPAGNAPLAFAQGEAAKARSSLAIQEWEYSVLKQSRSYGKGPSPRRTTHLENLIRSRMAQAAGTVPQTSPAMPAGSDATQSPKTST